MDTQRPDKRQDGEYKSQVIAATNVVDLIGKTVSLKKMGRKYVGLCPFHSEKSPSFNVDPVKQFYHCFGCKKSGDAITFVMERDQVGFRDALRALGEAAGIAEPVYSSAAKEKAGQRKSLEAATSSAGVFFEKLLADPVIGLKARGYLQERGFNDQSIKNFHIGFAPDAWDGLLRSPLLKAYPPALLASAGLVKPRDNGNGFYDTFRDRLMFPIRDENGRVIAFGGRVLPGTPEKPADKAKYLNSPETPLFSKSRCLFGLDLARQKIVETRTVAVVEGYTDVVMAHQYGATNVVSPLGTALTDGHVQILRRFAEKIVLLFDADTAGELAVNRAVELFLTHPVEIAIASMPDGVDPDEFLIAHGLPAFEAVLRNATDALTFKWKMLWREFNASGDDLTGQQNAVEQYLSVLSRARESGPVDSLRWGSALARVSRLTDIPVLELNKRFKTRKPAPRKFVASVSAAAADAGGANGAGGNGTGASATGPDALSVRPRRSGPLDARARSERWVLAILLNEPHRWVEIQSKVSVKSFFDPTCRMLAEYYWQHQRDEGEVVFAEFLAALNELHDPEVSELAVNLVEEVELLEKPEVVLEEVFAFFEGESLKQEQSKHLAQLRRNSASDVETEKEEDPLVSKQNDALRKLFACAGKADMRRLGT